jgi:phosphoglycerol transferase MdoB-like AlkP superfamily enzyme
MEENKENRKLIDIKNILKNYGFWTIIILYLEFLFRLGMGFKFDFDVFLNILLYTLSISGILSIIGGILKDKGGASIRCIMLFVIGVLFSVQLVFHRILTTFFSVSNLLIADQATDYLDKALKGIVGNIIFILLFILPFMLYLIFKKKVNIQRNKPLDYLVYLILIPAFFGLFLLKVNLSKGSGNYTTYHVYYEVNSIELSIGKLGVLNSYRLDVQRAIFGFKQEFVEEKKEDKKEEPLPDEKEEIKIVYNPNVLDINFNKETGSGDIQSINNYLSNDSPTMQNEYTGLFKDYNLVYITAESFYDIAIDENITPTLYKLTHTGFVFNNFYAPYVLSTIGGELQSLTGLFPDTSILSTWRTGNNYFPYGLGTVFRDAGYNTYAYHNNNYAFQDRHQYLKSQGFDNYLACYNGLEERINCRIWPQSDDEMIEQTMNDYINSDKPFLAYYMTVSGHFEYNFLGDNTMSSRNKDKAMELQRGTTQAKAYVATQIELDKALARLISALEQNGKLDKTVFVMLADHYPYDLTMESINSLSNYERDDIVEVNHNALVLWNSKMETKEIDKVCMSIDVLPTVLNLFGIKYDSRLITGNDILDFDKEGIAIMKNHSWVTNKGTYFAASGTFNPKEGADIPEGYVENTNNIVTNRLNVSRMIIANNYYNYLLR